MPRARPGHAGPDPATGFFLMLLMAAATLLLTWDAAANEGWSGLSVVHAAMQAVLLLAALGSGSTGAVVWIGHRSHAT